MPKMPPPGISAERERPAPPAPMPRSPLSLAIERLTALKEPPKCPKCSGGIDAAWWSYCAACGYHIAGGGPT